jgi:hypothetical protein
LFPSAQAIFMKAGRASVPPNSAFHWRSLRAREIESWLKWHLSNTRVRRIVALPHLPADPVVAATLHKLTGAPLCTYIMDDKNVCADGIDDALMADLLGHSGLRLVISPEMREAYQKKYGLGFWVMPPLVPEALLKRDPVPFPAGADPRRGVLLGNIWGQRWLDTLRRVLISYRLVL